MNKIKALRKSAQLTQKALSELLNIPKRTIENWEAGVNEPPAYLVELIEYFLKNENYIKMEDIKMTNLNYRTDIMGDYIDKWQVYAEPYGDGDKVYTYTTEAGAMRKYDSLTHATIKRETTVVNQDVTVATK